MAMILIVCICPALRAEVHNLIPVHGVLIDPGRDPITERLPMKFAILNAEEEEIWLDNRAFEHAVDVEDGRFMVYLGELNPLPLELLRAAGELSIVLTVGEREVARYKIPAGLFAFEAEIGDRVGSLGSAQIQPLLDEPCGETFYLRGWQTSGHAPLCAELAQVSTTGIFADLTDIPWGLSNGDNDTTYDAGNGLVLSADNTFGLLRIDIDAWTSSACYDDLTELLEFLELASHDHGHSIDSIGDVPPAFADGSDEDTTYTAGEGLDIADGGLIARGAAYSRLVTVAKSGADFASIQAAVDSVTGQEAVLVWIAPGTYDGPVITKPHVHLKGFGREATIISSDVSNDGAAPSLATLVLSGNVSVRDLSIRNTGTGVTNVALLSTLESYQSLVADVNIRASASCAVPCDHYAVYLQGEDTRVEFRSVTAFGDTSGIYNCSLATAEVYGGSIGGEKTGLDNKGATVVARNTDLSSEGVGLSNTGGEVTLLGASVLSGDVLNSNALLIVSNAEILGSVNNTVSGTTRMNRVVIDGKVDNLGTMIIGNSTLKDNLASTGMSTVTVRNSDVKSVSCSNGDYANVYIHNTMLSSFTSTIYQSNSPLTVHISNSAIQDNVDIETGPFVVAEVSHSHVINGTVSGATCVALTKDTTFYPSGCP